MSGGRGRRRRVLIVVACLVAFPIFVAVVLASAIGIAELTGGRASESTLNRWGNVGQTFESVNTVFSGLAFVALVVTFAIQYQELRMQRIELQMQREAMHTSNGELHRSAEADLRRLHFELIKVSIDDPDLAAVWPEFEPGLSAGRNRQYLYANLVFHHVRLNFQIGTFPEEDARTMLRYLFESSIMRAYWSAAERSRNTVSADTHERHFAEVANEIYRERLTE
jgi:hypothetical protein